jgi:hypothetical protein
VTTHADVLYFAGLIGAKQRREAAPMQAEAAALAAKFKIAGYSGAIAV